MFLKNEAGKDAVWEAQQRGNEELVGWMLAFGEEQIVGHTTEEDAQPEDIAVGTNDDEVKGGD